MPGLIGQLKLAIHGSNIGWPANIRTVYGCAAQRSEIFLFSQPGIQ